MTVFEWILTIGFIAGFVERILKVLRDKSEKQKTKDRIDVMRKILGETEEVSHVIVKAIEEAPPELSSKIKPLVKSKSKDFGLEDKVHVTVQDIVGKK